MNSLARWLTDERIQYQESVNDWRNAINIVATPLLNEGAITQSYIDAIVKQKETTGPYFVIAPRIAMPHARPEEGGKALCLSVLKLGKGVEFGSEENDPVDFLVMFAAPDGNSHVELISELAEFLSDDEVMEKIFNATDKSVLEKILNGKIN